MSICGLIKKQFPLCFAKIDKIAYTCNTEKMTNIQIGITSFVYKISTQTLRVSYGFRGRRIQIHYLKFQGSQGSYHGNQIYFSAVNRGIYHKIKKFSGSANSNTPSKISRSQESLPWEPNFGKNKPKSYRLHFCTRNRGLFCTYSKVFGVGEFKYAIQNFKGAKGVAMATKFGLK